VGYDSTFKWESTISGFSQRYHLAMGYSDFDNMFEFAMLQKVLDWHNIPENILGKAFSYNKRRLYQVLGQNFEK
jgi:hypothetical protein